MTPHEDEKAVLAKVLGEPVELLFEQSTVSKASTESAG